MARDYDDFEIDDSLVDDHEEDSEDHVDDDDDSVCGPPTEVDCIDEELEHIVEDLERAGYDSEFAEDAVYTALAGLCEDGEGDDTPEMDEDVATKQTWVARHGPMIRRKLREDLKLTFEEG